MPELDPELYTWLRRLAGRIHRERAGGSDTLQPTALLHEAWEKAVRSRMEFRDRAHFVAVAALAMRQILIDRARSRRDAGERTTLAGVGDAPGEPLDVLDLDAALTALEALDPTTAQIALLRTFGGLSNADVASALGLAERRVEDEWTFARAWLRVRLRG
jgi:RNA polymerase sigma factor (TIGR02999 family)